MTYLPWLLAISLVFTLLERLLPWRPMQPLLRKGLVSDLGWLAINGHLFGLGTAGLMAGTSAAATAFLRGWGLAPGRSPVAEWPFAAQFAAFLVVADFLQWGVHNLLHRVPFLWAFHKVHHSVTTMDWLGASSQAVFAVAIASTVWGDFNHSNLKIGLGPLGRLLNSPRMHLWHHDLSTEGGTAKNFGIVLSVWDFLFGTAYWPRERSPERLGYPGMGEMPETLIGQVVWPLA